MKQAAADSRANNTRLISSVNSDCSPFEWTEEEGQRLATRSLSLSLSLCHAFTLSASAAAFLLTTSLPSFTTHSSPAILADN